jgi:CubicO group peptidase (beta-lactamase class C family)
VPGAPWGAGLGVVGESGLQGALGAVASDDAAVGAVSAGVPVGVAVGPGGDPVLVVVGVRQRLPATPPGLSSVHMVSEEVLRSSVSWLLTALAGDVAPDGIEAGFAPRLTEGRDIRTVLARRFAAFREHAPEVTSFERVGPAKARAVVLSGGQEWEFTVTTEGSEPYRIVGFQPHLVPADAVPWSDIVDRLRGLDHGTSRLPDALAARIHRRLVDAAEEGRIAGLCCGVVVGGEVVHSEYLGTADIRTCAPLNGTSVFRVGSVTKLVTAMTVLDLVEDGVLDLAAPVSAYAPGGIGATVGELLLHRGGLPKDLLRRRGVSALPGTLAEAVAVLKPAWPAGERAEYSSLGYELLGLLVEHVTGEAFADCCSRRVLARFGMDGAHLAGPGLLAPSTVIGNEIVVGKVGPVTEDVESYRSAGGMTADLPSVLALAGSLSRVDDPIVRRLTSHATPAGPGARFVPGAALLDREGGAVFWRGGSTRGFTAEIVAAADGSAAVVVLASATPAPGLRAVAEGLLRDGQSA